MIDSKEKIMDVIYNDILERNLLVKYGLYFKVKHILDRYDKEQKYLINSEVFDNAIILYYWPFKYINIDGFKINSSIDIVRF